MEFQHAIDAHLAWKQRLLKALRRGDLDAATLLGQEDGTRCILGQWIEGRLGLSPFDPHLAHLRDLHLEFHRVASLAIQGGLRGASSQQMRLDGRLQELSDQITTHLGFLRIHLGMGEPRVAEANLFGPA